MAHIPTFAEISEKKERNETLTALEEFVYENEPAGMEETNKFRRELCDLIDEVVHNIRDKILA